MSNLIKILFFLHATLCFSQVQLGEINNSTCVVTYPNKIFIYEQPMNTPSFESIQTEFFQNFTEFDPLYWTMALYIYPTANDAINNQNYFPRDRIARLVEIPYSNPKTLYFRIEENVTENPRFYIFKYVIKYNISPGGKRNYTLTGCKLDDNTVRYNLNQALYDIYGTNNTYSYGFYESYQDASNESNPIVPSEWDNYTTSSSRDNLYLRVGFLSSYTDRDCVSIFEIGLKTTDFSNYIKDKDLLFCGVPLQIDGPFDRNNVYQFSNFEWFHNGVLVSNQFNVTIDAIGEWIVYFDVSSGCRDFIKINVMQDNSQNYIKNVRSTMTQIIVEPHRSEDVIGYSLDGINWQESNVFNNSNDLLFNFYIKNSMGCLFGPLQYDVSNFFTFLSPNFDGYNDKWDIRSALKSEENNNYIQIFTNNGKLIKEGKLNEVLPWDGKLNNKSLPSGTYWYRIYNEQQEIKSGSILLKNK